LLETNQPKSAEQIAREILKEFPDSKKARRTLGFAFVQQERTAEAIAEFERLFNETNKDPVCVLDLARVLSQAGELVRAAQILKDVLEKVPTLTPGWFLLGDIRVEQRQYSKAQNAFSEAIANDPFRLQIDQCKRSIQEDDFAKAERIFRHILEQDPLHVEALAGMEVIAMATEDWIEAERLFNLIQKRTRYWPRLLLGLSQLFLMTNRAQEAKETLLTLVDTIPNMAMAWNMLGTANELLLQNEDAISAFEKSLQLEPQQPRALVSIGNIQRVMGNREASEKAFHQAAKFKGMDGEAYWGLSNLKDYVFSAEEEAAMRASLSSDSQSLFNAAPMFFALAKASEDRGDYAEAFGNYSKGNALQKQYSVFDSSLYAEEISRIEQIFDASVLERAKRSDASGEAPIFVVGMPRTGSTLVEQILASHSQVDATMELPFIGQYVRELNSRPDDVAPYPESISVVEDADFDILAKRYLSSAAIYRGGAPRFLDKTPSNFVHIGLIHLMFPGAIFVNISRNPMDTCLSVFKQRFAIGQSFSYSLEDIVAYFRGYRRLMAHWSSLLPTRVHTVVYENLVADPENEIRTLLDGCGLDFEAACLTPEKTDRAIRTPSSEQVRQPISAARIGYWQHFEEQLGHVRDELRDEIDAHQALLVNQAE
jgi:tetratricopeptide (TPR) repeat protein